jgi:hypothetical protein
MDILSDLGISLSAQLDLQELCARRAAYAYKGYKCLICYPLSHEAGLESREYGRRDPLRLPGGTFYQKTLTLTSLTSGSRSAGRIRSRIQATEFSFQLVFDATNLYGGVASPFLTSAIDGSEWSAYVPALYPRRKSRYLFHRSLR